MTREEFIIRFSIGGYGSKKNAEQYTNNNPKKEYDEEDVMDLYHQTKHFYGSHTMGLKEVYGSDGKTTAINHVGGNNLANGWF